VISLDEANRVLADDDEPQEAKHRERPQVLIVDDDRMIRTLIKLLLEKQGYDVIEGENGQQAIDLAMRERPDLLIVDLMMPKVDGYQAIDQIRREPSLAMLPVMVLTAENGPGAETRVLELGADDYMTKPFDPDILLARVRGIFQRLERAAA
jgi:DNA-binding response OmpR family regulator